MYMLEYERRKNLEGSEKKYEIRARKFLDETVVKYFVQHPKRYSKIFKLPYRDKDFWTALEKILMTKKFEFFVVRKLWYSRRRVKIMYRYYDEGPAYPI